MGMYYWIYILFLSGGSLSKISGIKYAISYQGYAYALIDSVSGITDELLSRYGIWHE